jgi:uncharacterized protein Yka (UPF0111/DUF47 family)
MENEKILENKQIEKIQKTKEELEREADEMAQALVDNLNKQVKPKN